MGIRVSELFVAGIVVLLLGLMAMLDGNEINEKRADAARVERIAEFVKAQPAQDDPAFVTPSTDADQH